MKIVLLSGGSGKRLWPLSNNSRAKQFLRLLTDKENRMESMLERVWRQLQSVQLSDSVYIASSNIQVDAIQNQLGANVPLIIEPMQRDTFAAIAMAAVYLYSVVGVPLDEVVCALPVDPYVETSFFNRIKVLAEIVKHEPDINIGLLGIKPTYPSEKYGYIFSQLEAKKEYQYVNKFIEKPDRIHAEKCIEQKAWWNAGVFVFKLKFLISLLSQRGFPTENNALSENYHKLPKNSFDDEVVEKTEKIIVLPYMGKWKDLGTWNTLTEEMPERVIGNGIISGDSLNSHLINELSIPVLVVGISNTVVAVSPDGILVSEKSVSPVIKDLVKKIDQRPMYEEKRWGTYRILDDQHKDGGWKVLTKLVKVLAGKNISYQMHCNRMEIWTIVSGKGEFILEGKLCKVQAGDVVKIPLGAKHSIKAFTDLELIEVQLGSELVEEDIIRYSEAWDDIIKTSNNG